MICQLAVRKDRMGRKKTSTEDLTGTCGRHWLQGLREVSKLKTKMVSTNKDLGVVREEE